MLFVSFRANICKLTLNLVSQEFEFKKYHSIICPLLSLGQEFAIGFLVKKRTFELFLKIIVFQYFFTIPHYLMSDVF